MADVHAHAFNALTAAIAELGIFLPLSVREALATAVEAAIEPEIRADEREYTARQILGSRTKCPEHARRPQPDEMERCLHCQFLLGLYAAARIAYGLPYPARLPEPADLDGDLGN